VVCTIIAVLPRDRFGRRRLLLIASFTIGLGPVFWLMVSEIFPSCIRSVAVSTVANWGAITTGGAVFLCTALGVLAVLIFLPAHKVPKDHRSARGRTSRTISSARTAIARFSEGPPGA